MFTRPGRILILSVTAFAMLSAPVLLDNTGLPFDSGIDAVAAGKGKGGGKGGGNSGGGGGGNSSKSSSASSSKSNGASKGKKADTGTVQTASVKGSGSKHSLNADLGRLNSLKRNINGLMNSNDPKMAGIRAYVIANGTLVDAQAAFATADADLLAAQSAYDALVASYDATSLGDLEAELLAVNNLIAATPEGTDPDPGLLAEQTLLNDAITAINASPELAALITASEGFVAAEGEVLAAEEAVSEDALREALLLAANPNRRSEDYLTPEIMAWASNELGVGDANGLIDQYLARR